MRPMGRWAPTQARRVARIGPSPLLCPGPPFLELDLAVVPAENRIEAVPVSGRVDLLIAQVSGHLAEPAAALDGQPPWVPRQEYVVPRPTRVIASSKAAKSFSSDIC